MDSFPPTPVTGYGITLLNEGIEPLITYTSPDGKLSFYLNGGLAPWPNVTEGIVLIEGMDGMHATFQHLDHKGARQAGTTWADTVYDPAEMKMNILATARTPEGLRKVIRKWIAAWDPKQTGTLSWVTPDSGEWWCKVRLFRPPPEKLGRTMARSREQQFTWSIRNDGAFWRSYDSTSTFQIPFNAAQDLFQRTDGGTLGPNWSQTYTGTGGVCQTTGARAEWAPSGTAQREVVNRWLGTNAVQTVTVVGSPTTWNLTLGAQTTGAITAPASAATVQAALVALSNIGSGNVSVAGSAGGPYTVTFTGTLANTNVATMSGAILTGGTNPYVTVASTTQGAPAVTSTDNQVIRFTLDSFYGWPWPTNARLDVWGRMDVTGTTGIRLRISGTDLTLSSFNAGVETVLYTRTLVLNPQRGEEWRLVCGASATARHYRILRGGFPIMEFKEAATGSLVGASYRGGGWGMRAGAGTTIQDTPPTIKNWAMDNNAGGASGYLPLTNYGDQEAFPELVVYGPGTFSFGNGPGVAPTITFGPLTDNQSVLIRTNPGQRGVYDLTGTPPEQDLPFFQTFAKSLFGFASNNDIPTLLSWFTSFFNVTPPQGNFYSLLKGRFTKGIPARTIGKLPDTSQLAVSITGGTAQSKVVAAITPLRRWPE